VVKSSSLIIEHQCPQCGAPATLEETDRLFQCEFCRVKSFLLSKVFRYVLPHSTPEDKELVYFPYWRFKGILFSCIPGGIKYKIVDISQQAIQSPYFPVSVGLRSQTLKLRFLSPETKGLFLKPSLSYKEVIPIIEDRFSTTLPKPIFDQSFIGETLSILYSPFYLESKVYDAVLNRPVSSDLPGDFNVSTIPGGRPDWNIQFIAAQCPDCGWDLEGDRDSIALGCKNCNSFWQSGKGRFIKLKFGHMRKEGGGPIYYLPFWRIKADTDGIELNSYANLVRIANLPRVIQEGWNNKDFLFWSPAFKVRPQSFLGLSRNLTLSQPQEKLVPELPSGRLYPVTLPIMEAVEGLKMNLASFVKPRGKLFPRLPDIHITPKRFTLVYIPLNEKGTELSQPAYRLRINKNILSFARNL